MRKTKAFRPAVSDALEQRLVLQGSGAVSALSVYKAELVASYVPNAVSNLYTPSFGDVNLSNSSLTPAQLSQLQASTVNQINITTSELDGLLSPLRKSKNIIGAVNTEMSNLSSEVNGLYTQLAAAFKTSGGVTTFNTNAGGLASDTISSMESSASNAIENQVQLFVFAKGVKPGKAFVAAMAATDNSQLATPFASLTSGVTTAFNTYLTNSNYTTFETSVYGMLGTLTTSANGVFSSNGDPASVLMAKNNQMTGGNASVYNAVLNFVSDIANNISGPTSTAYPTGFVSAALTGLDAVLQTDLAATGSA